MISIPLKLLVIHFIGDFVLQNDWMAKGKSKWEVDPLPLLAHVGVYSLMFVAWGFKFMAVTWVLHLLTDMITSKVTSRLWFFQSTGQFYNVSGCHLGVARHELFIPVGGNRHWFFVVIGLDQLIHYVCLALTWRFLA